MTFRIRSMVTCGIALVSAVALSTPASADPGQDPCDLAFGFLCRMLPIAPDLDHDIDLTTDDPQSPFAVPVSPTPVEQPPLVAEP
jgi:hypothetical protein